jgi:hypothetical protein
MTVQGRWILAAVLVQAAWMAVAASPMFFYPMVASAQRLFGGSIGWEAVFDDVGIYRRYASEIARGRVPYREIAIEYPIGALPWFLGPWLVARSEAAYRWAFAAEMMGCQAVLLVSLAGQVARRDGPRAVAGRLIWSTLMLGALGPLPISRYDLAPTALAFAAAVALANGRERIGGAWAAVGVLVKLFPAVVLTPLAMRPRHPVAIRGITVFLAVLTISLIGWGLAVGPGASSMVRYHAERGLEIESVGAGVLMAVGTIAGWTLRRSFDHTSERLLAPGADALAAAAPAVQLALLALVAWRARRGTVEEIPRFAGAAVLGFLIAGKVLSPQYLLWYVPFGLALEGPLGRRVRPPLLAACALTTAVYPWSFMGLIQFHPPAILLVNLRNLLLVALFGLVLFESPQTIRK